MHETFMLTVHIGISSASVILEDMMDRGEGYSDNFSFVFQANGNTLSSAVAKQNGFDDLVERGKFLRLSVPNFMSHSQFHFQSALGENAI
ncbi:hypothetical protein AAES_163314 [Amazona aestiva]|uniref:Uncharacterized protein n=1 Tax=Amazona aestiva TaxID=12930 RepID=A0A0Q3LTR8_AMAAE|nr:hypothetical protein AAES_163314 [Amazona aestiva]